jgi:hypothetical protein
MTRSEIKENLLVAMDTLRSRKIRSALTILGIVIGVTSVISVAAIIDGLNGYIQNRIKSFGSRSFFISRIPPGFTGLGRMPAKIRMRKYLQIEDAKYLRETVPGLDVSAAFANRIDFAQSQPDSIRYGDEHVERLIVRGTQPEFAVALPLFTVATGRYISPFDEEHARNVVVIGAAIADSLFPHTDPIGKVVRLDGRLYDVLGVFEKDPGLFGGFGVDQFACIPLSNFHKNFPSVRDIFLIFTVREDADLDTVREPGGGGSPTRRATTKRSGGREPAAARARIQRSALYRWWRTVPMSFSAAGWRTTPPAKSLWQRLYCPVSARACYAWQTAASSGLRCGSRRQLRVRTCCGGSEKTSICPAKNACRTDLI